LGGEGYLSKGSRNYRCWRRNPTIRIFHARIVRRRPQSRCGGYTVRFCDGSERVVKRSRFRGCTCPQRHRGKVPSKHRLPLLHQRNKPSIYGPSPTHRHTWLGSSCPHAGRRCFHRSKRRCHGVISDDGSIILLSESSYYGPTYLLSSSKMV
jgi:hypothetical protein